MTEPPPGAAARRGLPLLALFVLLVLQALLSVPRLAWEAATGNAGLPGVLFGVGFVAAAAGLVWRGRERLQSFLGGIAGRLERLPRRRWLAGALILGLALRIAWAVAFPAAQTGDGKVYEQLAAQLVRGEMYQTPGSGTWAEWPPGYPLLLSAVYLLAGVHRWALVLLNLALFAGTVLSAEGLARRLGGEGAARAAPLLLALWPNLIALAGIAAPELLGALLLTTALVVWLDAGIAPREAATAPWLAAGFALGLAGLTQPDALLLPLVLIGHDLLARVPARRAVTAWVVLLFGMTLPIVPWVIRNARIFHQPVIATSGGSLFYRANNPRATGGRTEQGQLPLEGRNELAVSREGYRLGRAWIERYPERFLALALRKQVLFLGDDTAGIDDTLQSLRITVPLPFLLRGIANLWWWALWLPVLLAAFVWTGRGGPPAGADLLLLAILLFWLIASVLESGGRHHLPLAGALAVLAALAFEGAGGISGTIPPPPCPPQRPPQPTAVP